MKGKTTAVAVFRDERVNTVITVNGSFINTVITVNVCTTNTTGSFINTVIAVNVCTTNTTGSFINTVITVNVCTTNASALIKRLHSKRHVCCQTCSCTNTITTVSFHILLQKTTSCVQFNHLVVKRLEPSILLEGKCDFKEQICLSPAFSRVSS